MKRSTKLQTERKGQTVTITGSRGRNSWNDPDEAEPYYEEGQAPEEETPPTQAGGSTRLLTIVQIIACAAVLAAAVFLRFNGGAVYQNVRSWYFDSMNDSIVADSQLDSVRHVVIDLWSKISSSRVENSQAESSVQKQSGEASSQISSSAGTSSAASNEKGNASGAAFSGAPLQGNAPNAGQNASVSASAP